MTMRHFIASEFLLAAACLAAIPALARAQPAEIRSQPCIWKSVSMKGGGFICNVLFSATQPGLAFCRTDVGGAYKWDTQARTWTPLTDWTADDNLMGAESIATDPLDPQRLYIAAGMHQNEPAAILRSMDQGKTFKVVNVPFRMGGNENGRGVGERLAIDPNASDILFFGSRAAGLWTSRDAALTWSKVDGFPASAPPPVPPAGAQPGAGRGAGVGLSFVVFDPDTGTRGKPTQTLYVGSTDPGPNHLFRSADAGQTWQPVPGQPANFMAIHASFDTQGTLYVVYANSPGPGGATDGALWKFNPKDGAWTDITPVKDANRFPGGYGGLGVERQHPGTLVLASLDRKDPRPGGEDDDRLYRTTDGGKTWTDISPGAHRDSSPSPYVPWAGAYDDKAAKPEASLGWWIDGLAIDPFDSKHVMYATGTTIWNTHDITNADSGGDTHWITYADGIEEFCVANLISPPEGPHLISAVSDCGGFTHDDLDVSPAQGANRHPLFANATWLEFAEKNPAVMVRTGVPPYHGPREGTMGYSLDGGHNWKPFALAPAPAAGGRGGGGNILLSADGAVFMATGGTPRISTDRGATWKDVTGLPAGLNPVADRANPLKFYALDAPAHRMFLSTDGGSTFAPGYDVAGLPAVAPPAAGRGGGAGTRMLAVAGREGDLWVVGTSLCHSIDGGKTFKAVPNHPPIAARSSMIPLSFGKAAPGKDYPAIFLINQAGVEDPAAGVFRSDDQGTTWVRINDAQHQWGNRIDCVAGDPRIYGRVYVGTFGRGAFYGDIAK